MLLCLEQAKQTPRYYESDLLIAVYGLQWLVSGCECALRAIVQSTKEARVSRIRSTFWNCWNPPNP